MKGVEMRTLSQIAREQEEIAKMYFHKPIIKTGKPFTPYVFTGPRKKLGHVHKKVGKITGEV